MTHRDLKPANILRLGDGRYVVADLGTAKREPRDSTVLTRTCAILGTLCYLAPEQMMPGGSRMADARTDVFQLGKMLYQLISGKLPAAIEAGALTPSLAHIILRATASRPDDRYPDVASFLDALEAIRGASAGTVGTSATGLERLLDRYADEDGADPARPEILHALATLEGKPAGTVLDLFDRLPPRILVALCETDGASFARPLALFARALEHAAGRRPFDYADVVTTRMRSVYFASRSPEIKAAALRAILVAGVVFNRYAAMDQFRSLIYDVRATDLALLVAEMLRDHRDYFQEVASHLNARRLHSAIAAVLDDLDWIETVSF